MPKPRLVKEFSPLSAAVDVPVGGEVVVVFDKKMDPLSISESSLFIQDVSANVVYDEGTNTATLKPIENLTYGTVYTVVMKPTIKALDKEELGSEFSWSFTTNARPGVVSSEPADGILRTDGSIIVNFTEALLESSLQDRVQLYNEAQEKIAINVVLSGNTLQVSPLSTLLQDGHYTLVLQQGITDLQQTGFEQNLTLEFDTPIPAAVELTSSNSSARYSEPKFVSQGKDLLAVAYAVYDGNRLYLVKSDYVASTDSWSGEQIVQELAFDNQVFADLMTAQKFWLSINDERQAFIWQVKNDIWASYENNGQWSVPVVIADSAAAKSNLSLAAAGTSFVATWMESNALHAAVFDGVWGRGVNIDSDQSAKKLPEFAGVYAANNRLMVYWVEEISSPAVVNACKCIYNLKAAVFDSVWRGTEVVAAGLTSRPGIRGIFAFAGSDSYYLFYTSGAESVVVEYTRSTPDYWTQITHPAPSFPSYFFVAQADSGLGAVWLDAGQVMFSSGTLDNTGKLGWNAAIPINQTGANGIHALMAKGSVFAAVWSSTGGYHVNKFSGVPAPANEKSIVYQESGLFEQYFDGQFIVGDPDNIGLLVVEARATDDNIVLYSAAFTDSWTSLVEAGRYFKYAGIKRVHPATGGGTLILEKNDHNGLAQFLQVSLPGGVVAEQKPVDTGQISGQPTRVLFYQKYNDYLILIFEQTHGSYSKTFSRVIEPNGNIQDEVELGSELRYTQNANSFAVLYKKRSENKVELYARTFTDKWSDEHYFSGVSSNAFASTTFSLHDIVSNDHDHLVVYKMTQVDQDIYMFDDYLRYFDGTAWKSLYSFNYSPEVGIQDEIASGWVGRGNEFAAVFSVIDPFSYTFADNTYMVFTKSDTGYSSSSSLTYGSELIYPFIFASGANYVVASELGSSFNTTIYKNKIWSQESTVTTDLGNINFTKLLSNLNTTLLVARDATGYKSITFDGVTWATVSRLLINDAAYKLNLFTRIDQNFEAILFKPEGNIVSRTFSTVLNNWVDNDAWNYTNLNPGEQMYFRLIDAQGKITMIWGSLQKRDFYVSTLTDSWSTPLHLGQQEALTYVPEQIELDDATGRASAAWVDKSGDKNRLFIMNGFRLK